MRNANYSDTFTDLGFEGDSAGIARTYNSRPLFDGLFGFGWCSDFETAIRRHADGAISLVQCGAGSTIRLLPTTRTAANALVRRLLLPVGDDVSLPIRPLLAPARRLPIDASLLRTRLAKNPDFLDPFAADARGGAARGHQTYRSLANDTADQTAFGLTVRLLDGMVYSFDNADRLIAVDARRCDCKVSFGKTLAIAYAAGRPSVLTLGGKNRVSLAYAANGKIASATASDGRVASYRYSAIDKVVVMAEVKNAWDNVFTYGYDQFINLERIGYPDRTSVELKYDKRKDWVSYFKDRRNCIELYTYVDGKVDPANRYSSFVEKRCGGKITNVSRFDFVHKFSASGTRYLSQTVAIRNGKRTVTTYSPDGTETKSPPVDADSASLLGFVVAEPDKSVGDSDELRAARVKFDRLYIANAHEAAHAALIEWLNHARRAGQPALDEWALTALCFSRDAIEKGTGLKVKENFAEIDRIVQTSRILQEINFFTSPASRFYYLEAASRELEFDTANHLMRALDASGGAAAADRLFFGEDLGEGRALDPGEDLLLTLKAIELKGRKATTADLTQNLLRVAELYTDFGELRAALRLYAFLLDEKERRGVPLDRFQLSRIYTGLAGAHSQLGDHEKAVAFYRRDIDLGFDDAENYARTVDSLLSLFFLYARQLNNIEAARPFLTSARTLIERFDRDEAIFRPAYFNAQADILNHDGKHAEALARAEQTYVRVAQHSYFGASARTSPLAAIAFAAEKLGRYDKALAARTFDLQISTIASGSDSPDAATAMFKLALVYNRIGQPQRALDLLRPALRIHEAADGANSYRMLDTLIETERAYQGIGDVAAARALVPRITERVELLRDSSALDDFDRRVLFEKFADHYKAFARLYAASGAIDDAFVLADRSKGRTLVDKLKAQIAAKFLPADERQGLAEKEDALRQFERVQAGGDGSAGTVAARRPLINQRRAELAAFNRRLGARYPKYRSFLIDGRLDSGSIRTALREGEVFLDYVIDSEGDAQLFVVNRKGLTSLNLGRLRNYRSTVDAMVELTSPYVDSFPGRLVALDGGGWAWRPGTTGHDEPAPATNDPAAARAIIADWGYRTLIRPALPMIGDRRELIVSPDGYLALMPFDVLRPTAAAGQGDRPLLVDSYSIRLVQSFAVFQLLRAREIDYVALNRKGALLAMGNAVYNDNWPAGDPAGRGRDRGEGARLRTFATRSIDPASGAEGVWQNLPGTRSEIEGVSQLFGVADVPADGCTTGDGAVRICTGHAASKATLTRLNGDGGLAGYRYLLFSAHGYLDAATPDRSALVLTLRMPSARKGERDIDGMIMASQWPAFDLRSDLTVLSACQTGVGQPLSGEAIMGLPYAMFIAGNRNTLLSLWPVDDEATAAFMKSFFAKLRSGQRQAEALRETKREFVADGRWSDPVYWAAFVLYGS